MKKLYKRIIGSLALGVMFVFPGTSGFPQEVRESAKVVQKVQGEKSDAAKQQEIEEKVEFPILIGIP